jgi:hypothetical protein
MPLLIIAYHIIFLTIFLITAIVALGAITQFGPFARVPERYTKILATVLIVELIGAVISIYQNLPPFEYDKAEQYNLRIAYSDYLDQWQKSLNPHEQECINDFNSGTSRADCYEIIGEYESTRSSIRNNIGNGEIFLSFNTSQSAYKGIVVYTFPAEHIPTVIRVDGRKFKIGNVEKIILDFTQQTRFTSNGTSCKERSPYTYSIEFTPDPPGSNAWKGILFHPNRKVDSKPFQIGEISLFR